MVWEPEQYVQGNYFQTITSEAFYRKLAIQPSGSILDIGCGDGAFTHWMSEQLTSGSILGIDNSEEMIRHAHQQWVDHRLCFEVRDIETIQYQESFDFIVSFWCLHWTDITVSLPAIYRALKKEGWFYALFSSFSDNSILQTWRALDNYEYYFRHMHPPATSSSDPLPFFFRLLFTLSQLPFKKVSLELQTIRVPLPDLSCFKHLVLTMPFMSRLPEAMRGAFIEDMVRTFEGICQRNYNGKYVYETRPVFLEAIK